MADTKKAQRTSVERAVEAKVLHSFDLFQTVHQFQSTNNLPDLTFSKR
jgi:hypothetical protein